MAHRRMISQDIIDTDIFARMPQSARYLYYELLVRADDDGFIGAPLRVIRMVECTEKDLDELIKNRYVISFESGIIVIRDWKIHNSIRKDIYKKTMYQEEFNMLCEVGQRYYLKTERGVTCGVTDGVTDGVTLGKVRKGKDSIGKGSIDYQQIADMYNATCVSFPRITKLSETRKKAIKARMKIYSVEDFQKLFEMAEGSSFLKGQNNRNWSANFDWMMKDANFAKILDGNYQDKEDKVSNGSKTVEPEENPYSNDWVPDYMRNMTITPSTPETDIFYKEEGE